MNYELAKSTGFTVVQQPQENFSEVLYKALPNPVEDTSRSGFAFSDKKDRRIKELIKKAKGGSVKSASARADGCAQRGKTKGRMV